MNIKDLNWILIGIGLSLAFFLLDLSMPLGVAGGVPYVAVVLITLWIDREESPLFAGFVGSILTILGYFLSPELGTPWVVIMNRLLALFGIWIAVIVITIYKKKDQQLKESLVDLDRMNQELESSNQDLEHFAYIASHDLQEPLRKVDSFLGMVRKRLGEDRMDSKTKDYMDRTQNATARMKGLIQELLEFSRVGRGCKMNERVDPNREVQKVLGDLEGRIRAAKAEVKVGSLPMVMGNKELFGRLLQNLVGNALKFTREGVFPRIEISGKKNGKEAVFRISDNGPGIPGDLKNDVFQLFSRNTGAKQDGSGIGLAICKKVVERSGGRIWYESKEGEGTAFYFTHRTA